MANYLYKTTIVKNPDVVDGIASADIQMHKDDKVDYETNHQSSVTEVEGVTLAETTFVITKKYTDFKALIDGTIIKWTDVKATNVRDHILNLLSATPLP